MEIPITPERKKFGEITFFGSNKELEDFLETTDKVKIIERMDTGFSEMCYWFVFGKAKWFKRMNEREKEAFITNADALLGSKGYHKIEIPKNGDIAVYSFSSNEDGWVAHYGEYCNGKVRSKFGRTHIYEHDIGFVPSDFGDTVKFFRKSGRGEGE